MGRSIPGVPNETGSTVTSQPSLSTITDPSLIQTEFDGKWTYYQHPVQPKAQIPVDGIFGTSTNTGGIRVKMSPENVADVKAEGGLTQALCNKSMTDNTEWCGTYKTDGTVRECTTQENEWCQKGTWSEFTKNNTSGAQYHGPKWMEHIGYKPDPNFRYLEHDFGDYT